MKKADLTIFEYRKEKNIKNTDAVIRERLFGKFEKGTVRTDTSGYVDFSIYRPEKYVQENLSDPLPVVFNFHGGGFDASRVFLCGHSAGGAIAADLCLLDRERKQIGARGQIIDYAPLKQTISEADRQVKDSSKAIKMSRVLQYVYWYFENLDDMNHELASPLYADLHELPDMLVISAEYDSLAEEEEAFAQKAAQSGVTVTYRKFKECQHGFTHEGFKEYRQEQAKEAWALMADFIKKRL